MTYDTTFLLHLQPLNCPGLEKGVWCEAWLSCTSTAHSNAPCCACGGDVFFVVGLPQSMQPTGGRVLSALMHQCVVAAHDGASQPLHHGWQWAGWKCG